MKNYEYRLTNGNHQVELNFHTSEICVLYSIDKNITKLWGNFY